MTTEADLLRAAVDASAPGSEAVARVRDRTLGAFHRADALLRSVPEPHPAAAARVRARLRTPAPSRSAWPAFALAGAALAAALLLWPRDAALPERDLGPRQALQLTPEVHLDVTGQGATRGTRYGPAIAWQQGRLDVDVTPGQGVDLVVRTEEAEVRVVGTRFAVDRDALGSHVTVDHGAVRVRCVDGDEVLLEGGARHTCLPVRAGALLGRARALAEAGAPDAEVEATLTAALASADGAVRGELLAARLELELRRGDHAAARTTAETYLAEGHAERAAELREVVRRLTPATP